MKTMILKKLDYPLAPYPNAATLRETLHKVVNNLLIAASCAGIASVILLLFAMA